MSRNGLGTYNLPAGNPFITGTTISSTTANTTLSDIGTAITNSISTNGESVITGNIPLAGFKLTGMGAGSALTDNATLSQVQNGLGNYGGVAGGTANALTISTNPAITAYAVGQKFTFKAGATFNTGATTIAINGLAAIAVQFNGAALAGNEIKANAFYEVFFDTLTTCQLTVLGNAILNSTAPSKLPTIVPTVALNALTIGVTSQYLDFRSATLSSGTISTINAAPNNIVVASGATLGTINAVSARLVVLEMNNAGTAEIAVLNSTTILSGLNIDETTLITTKAIATVSTGTGVIAVTTGVLTISGTPTGAWEVGQIIAGTGVPAGTYITSLGTGTGGAGTYNTNIITAVASTAMTGAAGFNIYSTTARTALPFRVVGFIDITEAVAGTWASAQTGTSGIQAAATATTATTATNLTGTPTFFAPITASLSADVLLTNISTYFDGPSVAQGTLGKWFVSGTITVEDNISAQFLAKLWDGTTVISSCATIAPLIGGVSETTITLSGFISAPAGNLRISVVDGSSINGVIKANRTGFVKDSTITAFRIG